MTRLIVSHAILADPHLVAAPYRPRLVTSALATAACLAVATAGCAYHLALEGPATDAELCEMAFFLPFVPSAGVGWDRAYAATRDCAGAPGELPVRSGWCGGRQCAAWVGDTAPRCLPPGVETREEPTVKRHLHGPILAPPTRDHPPAACRAGIDKLLVGLS